MHIDKIGFGQVLGAGMWLVLDLNLTSRFLLVTLAGARILVGVRVTCS